MATFSQLSIKSIVNGISPLSWPQTKCLAIQLEVQTNTLDDIENDFSGGDRKVHAMQAWLNNDPDASWEKLVAALQKIEMSTVASQVASTFCPYMQASNACVYATVATVPNPGTPNVTTPASKSAVVVVPKLTEQEVKKMIGQLRLKFSLLVTKCRTALSKQEKESPDFLEEFRDALLLLPVTNSEKPLHETFFQKNSKEFFAAQNINDLFLVLSRYWNYTNYSLLVHVVEIFCDAGLVEEVSQYCLKLDTFERATTIDVFITASSASDETSHKFIIMAAKINKSVSECTLYEIRKLKQSIAERSGITPYSVYIDTTGSGSVKLTLGIHPAALSFVLATLNRRFLLDNLLTEVVIGGKQLQEFREMESLNKQLINAVEAGNVTTAAGLLNAGASINTARGYGSQTPLHMASGQGYMDTVHLLLERGAHVNARNEWSQTPLHESSRQGYYETVCLLLKWGAEVDARDEWSQTSLHEASREGHLETVRLLLEQGADADARDKWSWAPLHVASENGHLEIVHLLLEHGEDVNPRDESSLTPLHMACDNEHLEIVLLLLEEGADVAARDKSGFTALCRACSRGNLGMVQTLVNHGADVEVQTNDGMTPLNLAATMGHTDIVQYLTKHGTSMHTQEKNEQLLEAVEAGDVATVEMLLDAGADVNATGGYFSWTPLHIATDQRHLDTTELLLERGAKVDVKDTRLWTPLHKASQYGHCESVRLLLDHGAQVDMRNEVSLTPLHVACEGGHLNAARLLLEHGADVDARDEEGDSALITATLRYYPAVVQLLAGSGADLNIQNEEGSTALLIAVRSGRTDIINILLKHGCNVDIQEYDTGWPALFFAAENGDMVTTNLLLNAGANALLKDNNNMTALDIAKLCSTEVFEVLNQHIKKTASSFSPSTQQPN